MIDYESPFSDEFSADGEYWDKFELPWNEEDEELNIHLLLMSKNDF
jgi:hypothetical protein